MSSPSETTQLENLDAQAAIASSLNEHSGRACVTCSFQVEDMVVLHMLLQRLPEVPVLFLETGYHFAETYAYRDRMTAAWKLNLVNVMPSQTVERQESEMGVLYQTDPTACCERRKVEPLMKALEPFDLWFTGLRREQSPTRAKLQVKEPHRLPSGKEVLKVSPLAAWNWKQVWAYAAEHHIEYLPLYDQGYRSIGCEPCTNIPVEDADARSGRWGGRKLECGIHTFSKIAE